MSTAVKSRVPLVSSTLEEECHYTMDIHWSKLTFGRELRGSARGAEVSTGKIATALTSGEARASRRGRECSSLILGVSLSV